MASFCNDKIVRPIFFTRLASRLQKIRNRLDEGDEGDYEDPLVGQPTVGRPQIVRRPRHGRRRKPRRHKLRFSQLVRLEQPEIKPVTAEGALKTHLFESELKEESSVQGFFVMPLLR